MAGVADRAFREICREFGAGYLVGEMASAKGLCMSDRKTAQLLEVTQNERPMAVQIFGDDPDTMARAAVKCMSFSPDIIDINMGCPAHKVAGNGGGAALMKNPALCGQIVAAVSGAVPVPVTVKIRKGWDDETLTAVKVASLCEENGAKAVAVHGRTRMQMYAPPVDLSVIRDVKKALSVPVIGNGDIKTPEDAARMLEYTGCDYLFVGRGALGNPWIFAQINAHILHGQSYPDPSLPQRLSVLLRHIQKGVDYKGEYVALKEARKHAAWYVKGFPRAAELRRKTGNLSHFSDLEDLVREALDTL